MIDQCPFCLHAANRLASASEVLGTLAERDGRVETIMRLRSVLERIASMDGEAGQVARRELGWN